MTPGSVVKARMTHWGEQHRHQAGEQAHRQGELDADGHHLADALGVFFAPVLGGQNEDGALDAAHEHLQHRLELPANVHPRDGVVP